MELIVTLAVLALAGYWVYDLSQKQKKDADTKVDAWQPPKELTEKPAEVSGSEYRVESTAPKCGCGRSPTGFCVGLHKLTPEQWATHDQNPNRTEEVAAVTAANKVKAAAKAKTAVKKTADKKPATKRTPAKKKSN